MDLKSVFLPPSCLEKKVIILVVLFSFVHDGNGGVSKDGRQLFKLNSSVHQEENVRDNITTLGRCLNAYRNMEADKLARLIDASGKQGSGIYGGNTLWLGSFSQCKQQRNAHYCLVIFPGEINLMQNKPESINLQWGACVPDGCDKENLIEGLEFILNNISRIDVKPFSSKLNRNVKCAEDPEYTTGVVLTIVFCGLILALCLLGTVLEIMNDVHQTRQKPPLENSNHFSMDKDVDEKSPLLPKVTTRINKTQNPKKAPMYEIMNCFSLIRNTNFILNTSVGKSDLTYLHGIRVLSLFWIILAHSPPSLNGYIMPTENTIDLRKHYRKLTSMVILNGNLAVNTFFLLSGLLVVYVNLLKRDKDGGESHWFKFYFHRFWRLTPTYMFAILFLTKLGPFMGDGPLWYNRLDTSACSDYWWTNLLYINNIYPKEAPKKCILPAWYLAVDMQFFILSPLLIIIGFRYGFRLLAGISSIVILANIITVATIIGDENLNPIFPSPISSGEETAKFFHDVYTKPYCRIQTYVLGMVLGYILYKYFSRQFTLRWYAVLTLWMAAVGAALAVILAPYSAVKEDPHEWTKGVNVVYGSFKWLLWDMSVAWVIFACHYGYAGVIKNILAANFWIPLSRINYVAFILHYELIFTLYYNVETPIHFTTFTQHYLAEWLPKIEYDNGHTITANRKSVLFYHEGNDSIDFVQLVY